MRKNPLISVGLPVYNGSPHLKDAIESLLAQTYGDFEIIISDNASTDDTQDVCEHYVRLDNRVRYHRNAKNIGLIKNFNSVFERAEAPYFKWVAHDDIHEPRYLECCFPPVRDDPSISVSHCETTLVDAAGISLPYEDSLNFCVDPANGCRWYLDRTDCATRGPAPKRFRDVLAYQIMCGPVYGLMPRHLLKQTVLNRTFFGSDKLLLAEMALLGRFHIVRERLFKKRMHAGMTSVKKGGSQATYIDPESGNKYLRLQKLASYLTMLKHRNLSPGHRLACWYYLAVHSASSVFPLDWRYRPQLVPSDIATRLRKITGSNSGRPA
jgi:glycosyltransferase involved in cell wall biosynthesis